MIRSEQEKLDSIARNNSYDKGINGMMVKYTADLFMRYMRPGNVLEMGPAQGLASDIIFNSYPDYSVVDASDMFVKGIKERHPQIKGYTSLFEDFVPPEKYNNILLSHVLEHVANPVGVLKKCKKWLKSDLCGGGVILASVPNSSSLHRLAGVKLKILSSASELHEGDLQIGHRRVYDIHTFVKDFEEAGFSVIHRGGYWLKPISNAQIEKSWSKELIRAYMELGEDFPEIACNIYVVAK